MADGIPIIAGQILGSAAAQAGIRRFAEKASQTFLQGVPVIVEVATGFIIESPTISGGTEQIAGVSIEPGNNLDSSGVAQTLNYGSVQNQSSAVLIPVGAPPNDGKMGVLMATDETVYHGKVRDADTITVTNVGVIFGLTKSGNNFWEVDLSITSVGSGAVVVITELDDDAGTLGGKVFFKINRANQQFGK